MLALVHPVQHNPSVESPHRTPARTVRPPPRKSITVVSQPSITSSASRVPTVAPPHLQTRSTTAPAIPTTHVAPSLERPVSYSNGESSRPPHIPPAPLPPKPSSTPQEKVNIYSYPSQDLLKLLASLLTKIATTNDKLSTGSTHDNGPSPSSSSTTHPPIWKTLTTASRSSLSTPSSMLTFHARNIPTITLEAYFLRILKYCPTTNEVFLSLLVYFERMSKLSSEATGRTFVIDSYNIHRLVIAGVTVASKFFSDVFYTNSRYAKVGGLPLAELNQLELQFLLLNDFRLSIPTTEMQHYAEQLIAFSHADGEIPSFPSPMRKSTPPPSAPLRSMGAIDAYGGKIPTTDARVQSGLQEQTSYQSINSDPIPERNNRTPPARPRWYSFNDDTSDTGTEGAETDGGETTDDEPTIRPAHSSASSEIDSQSLFSVSTDDGDYETDGMEVEIRGMTDTEDDEEGDRSNEGELTPERPGKGKDELDDDEEVDDHRMASP